MNIVERVAQLSRIVQTFFAIAILCLAGNFRQSSWCAVRTSSATLLVFARKLRLFKTPSGNRSRLKKKSGAINTNATTKFEYNKTPRSAKISNSNFLTTRKLSLLVCWCRFSAFVMILHFSFCNAVKEVFFFLKSYFEDWRSSELSASCWLPLGKVVWMSS